MILCFDTSSFTVVTCNVNVFRCTQFFLQWGMTAMSSFVLFAALLLALGTGKWEEILQESGRSRGEVEEDVNIDGVQ